MQAGSWKVGVLSVAAIFLVAGEAAAQRQSGIQRTPDNARVLVSKDVGGQRYAITLNTADGTVTGNVFSTDGSAPKFISCVPTGTNAFSCRVADTCDASDSRQSGIQQVFGGTAILVSKDVGADRYAITQNVDGTLTGNVFGSATGAATFLVCTPDNAGGYSCAVAGTCATLPCTGQYSTIQGSVTLPATFFTLPATCATYGPPIAITLPKNFFVPDPEVMGQAARQAIVNNPFRTTNVATDDQLAKDAAVNDLIFATRNPTGPAKVGDTALCPAGGLQRLVGCESVTLDSGGSASASTIVFDSCTVGSPSDGFIVQKGTLYILAPSSPCLLVTQAELPIGIELSGGRQNFETTFMNGAGQATEIDLENSSESVTYLNTCPGVDPRFRPTLRRQVSESFRSQIMSPPGVGEPKSVVQMYDTPFSILREYSTDCSTRIVTLESRQSGEIATVDDRVGESYATRFADLKYALSGPNDATSLSIDGGLLDTCTGIGGDRSGDRSFAYRTLTPGSFNRDGDGCPRGGAFELSAEGVVIGQVSFGDAGGVTLTPVSGPPITLVSCNDPQLLLTKCPVNDQM